MSNTNSGSTTSSQNACIQSRSSFCFAFAFPLPIADSDGVSSRPSELSTARMSCHMASLSI